MTIAPADFEFLVDFIKKASGISLSKDKGYLLESRLLPIIRKHGFTDISGLVVALKTTPGGEIKNEVIEAMSTNETSFFRDMTPFQNLEKEIIPILAEKAGPTVRVWSAACSSGQEAYSTAITLLDNKAAMGNKNIEIYGSDINGSIVNKAKAAIYSQFDAQRGLPITTLMKYFTQEGENWVVNDEVKSMTKFEVLNLLDDYSKLGKFDIIFLRNVLIYFEKETKKEILEKMARSLHPHGALFLGAVENPQEWTDVFVPFKPGKNGLFKLA
jgi:chemotaxis protein methyltransferase CheR